MSNEGSGEFQDLQVNGKKLYQQVAENVAKDWNANGNCLLVVGATYPDELAEVRKLAGDMTILVPGIGAQGGDIEATLKAGMNSDGTGLIINSSRAIIYASDPAAAAKKMRDEISQYRSAS
jgi:orotidine-5'-phosphate decarboxylase